MAKRNKPKYRYEIDPITGKKHRVNTGLIPTLKGVLSLIIGLPLIALLLGGLGNIGAAVTGLFGTFGPINIIVVIVVAVGAVKFLSGLLRELHKED